MTARTITAETRIAGVIGHPVRHSLSPVIHNAWIDAADLDAVYLAFAPPREGFRRLVEGLRGGPALGLNVTLPYKEEALAMADEVTSAAAAAGAANLLILAENGSISADNTDGTGLLAALGGAGFNPAAGRCVVLGAGGASRGVVIALLAAGVPQVAVLNRTRARVDALATLDPRVSAHDWTDRSPLEDAAALINATSLGMIGQPPLELSLDAVPRQAVVMDMVYKPLKTELLAAAQRRGHQRVDDGLEPGQGLGIAGDLAGKLGAVDLAVLHRAGKGVAQQRRRGAAPGVERVHRRIGVLHRRAGFGEHGRRRGLAHADGAGEAEHDHDASPKAFSQSARTSTSAGGAWPNIAWNEGAAWPMSMARPSATGWPRRWAAARSSVFSGL